jgi:tRNA(Arg) A34 adenosine deaminase TadA
MLDDAELQHLRRCLELATEALEAGDEPFGSVLVAEDGTVLAEDHNRVASGDRTRHPEFELARWAAANLTPGERAAATVFTSGEHCPMCAAAHGWVGLGRIVYVSSSEQLAAWLIELGVPAPPVRPLPIREVVPHLVVEGPVPELAEQVRDLHRAFTEHPEPQDGDPAAGASPTGPTTTISTGDSRGDAQWFIVL